jgi:hypothetical protein
MKERFVSSGGAIFEGKSLSSISVHDDFAVLNLSDGGSLPCRLVIDAMGNFSPIVRQVFLIFNQNDCIKMKISYISYCCLTNKAPQLFLSLQSMF